MSQLTETSARCGCCEDVTPLVPRDRYNPPAQTRIDARVGTQAAFKADMLEQLSRTGAMRRLTVREDDDPTIALLDGWASVLDILGFYQDEIANEGYLRTAEERLSVRQMAAGIGYKIKPGVGSETWLAFECEFTPSTPDEIQIPAGTQAQSTPAPEEMPQAFETKEDVIGRPRWNAMRARLTSPVSIIAGMQDIYLAGTDTGLAQGMALLIVAAGSETDPAGATYDLRYVRAVEPFDPESPSDPRPAYTRVTLDQAVQNLGAADNAEVHVLHQRAAAFGHNAIAWRDLPLPLRVGEIHPNTNTFIPGPYRNRQFSWADALYGAGRGHIFLDQAYPALVDDSWLVFARSSQTALYRITDVRTDSVNDFLISAKVSRLSITGTGLQFFSPRTAGVFCQSARLALAEQPETSAVSGNTLTLNVLDPDLKPGRCVALSGVTTSGETASDVLKIEQVTDVGGLTRLVFETAMANSYERLSLRVNANVVAANLGASRSEVLGSADASLGFQRFRLQSTPLSYVSAVTPSGADSTLEVRVDGELWQETPDFFGRDTSERVYTVTYGEDGTATLTFGDGRTAGARPASGQSNVTAKFRVGIGTDGNLAAGRIDQLTTRPLGVKGVINPVPASGAQNSEETVDARRNAARQTRLVNRIVTLTDYEDFAAGFSGISKAFAQTLWNGATRLVHITVAGAAGAEVHPGTALYQNLRDAIDAVRHSDEPFSLGTHFQRSFSLKADIVASADLVPDTVAAAARARALDAFSFQNRAFGKAVTQSEIMSVLHDTPGVEGIVLRVLDITGQEGVRDTLPAALARITPNGLMPTEMLVIDPDTLDLKGSF